MAWRAAVAYSATASLGSLKCPGGELLHGRGHFRWHDARFTRCPAGEALIDCRPARPRKAPVLAKQLPSFISSCALLCGLDWVACRHKSYSSATFHVVTPR